MAKISPEIPENLPLVSIITPSLNQGEYIEETISSVLSQDYPRLEHIVVDGGSTDATLDILKKTGDRIKWLSEPDRGQSHALNKGVGLARGDIIGWLNSDDLYVEGAVTEAVDFLRANPECAMVYGQAEIVDEAGRRIRSYETEPFDIDRLAGHCLICQPSAFVRADVLRDVGGVDEALHFCMDMDLWIRIGREHKIGFIDELLAQSRWHAANKTFGSRKAALIEAMRVVRRHYGRVPKARIRAYVEHSLEEMFGSRLRTDGVIYKNMRKLSTSFNSFKYNFRRERSHTPGTTRTNTL